MNLRSAITDTAIVLLSLPLLGCGSEPPPRTINAPAGREIGAVASDGLISDTLLDAPRSAIGTSQDTGSAIVAGAELLGGIGDELSRHGVAKVVAWAPDPSGELAVVVGAMRAASDTSAPTLELWLADAKAKRLLRKITAAPARDAELPPKWSPRGKEFAYAARGSLVVVNPHSRTMIETSSGGMTRAFEWHPSSEMLAYIEEGLETNVIVISPTDAKINTPLFKYRASAVAIGWALSGELFVKTANGKEIFIRPDEIGAHR